MEKALTIAGSDSGGGAGIQADLKTFQELKVFGMSALTAVTAQNTLGVQGVFPMEAEAVARQIQSLGEDIGVDALKTGMLFNAEIIETVAEKIKQFAWDKVVIDPVMIAKGGASLLQQEAVSALKDHLLPLCLVVTPNIPEAEVLTGMTIHSHDDKKEAARSIHALGAKNVVIKGGHEVFKKISGAGVAMRLKHHNKPSLPDFFRSPQRGLDLFRMMTIIINPGDAATFSADLESALHPLKLG